MNTLTPPFLKWAGNKYRILSEILKVLPPGRRLIEPFVGSGAVFLNTRYPQSVLGDSNADLIFLYRTLQNRGTAFLKQCETYFNAKYNSREDFVSLRSEFNASYPSTRRACLFLYLNRHCFNGLCRYNRSGKFNTPFGQYTRPYFPKAELLHFIQRSQQAEFVVSDFVSLMKTAKRGDVVYCDPPYFPLSPTSNFTSYHSNVFGLEEQKELAQMARSLSKKGVSVVISNHDLPETRKLYRGARIRSFPVRRYISAKVEGRRKVMELVAVF